MHKAAKMGNQEQGNSGEKAESSVPSGHGSLGSNSGVVERRLELLDEQLAELRQHIESPLFKGLYIDDAGAGALPLLDRAKSAVNVAYALESLLYCEFFSVAVSCADDGLSSLASVSPASGAKKSWAMLTHQSKFDSRHAPPGL